jgi:hypothetical protein
LTDEDQYLGELFPRRIIGMIQTGRGGFGEEGMDLTEGERLILLVLAEIGKRLNKIEDGVDYQFIEQAVRSGNYWALSRQFDIETPPKSRDTALKVADVMGMWRFIETNFATLSKHDQQSVVRS